MGRKDDEVRPLLADVTGGQGDTGRRRTWGACCGLWLRHHKLLVVSFVLWIPALVVALYFGSLLFGIFGSVPGLPASNTTGLAQPFDLGLVQHLAQLAAVAVCPAAAVRSWSCAECIAPTSHGAVSNVTVISSDYSGGLQGVVLVDRTTPHPAITVGFRGTTAAANWAIDFDVRQIKSLDYFGSPPPNATTPMLVHEGYQTSYDGLRPDLLAAVKRLCHLGLPINVTGHSLGGSLAMLAAFDLAVTAPCANATAAARPNSTLATFGTPRTGNPSFVAGFEAAMLRAGMANWRVVHYGDLAPAGIARNVGTDGGPWTYRHPGREVWFNKDGSQHAICDGSGEDPKCSDSVKPLGRRLIDHSLYVGVPFTNPCGGADPAAAVRGYLVACGVIAALIFVLFVARVRRYRRLEREGYVSVGQAPSVNAPHIA